jgi:hypothetical protein
VKNNVSRFVTMLVCTLTTASAFSLTPPPASGQLSDADNKPTTPLGSKGQVLPEFRCIGPQGFGLIKSLYPHLKQYEQHTTDIATSHSGSVSIPAFPDYVIVGFSCWGRVEGTTDPWHVCIGVGNCDTVGWLVLSYVENPSSTVGFYNQGNGGRYGDVIWFLSPTADLQKPKH